jgi:hypothetical protein
MVPIDGRAQADAALDDAALQPAASLYDRAQLASLARPAGMLSRHATVRTEQDFLPPDGETWPDATAADHQGQAYSRLSGVTLQWWLGRGRSNIGFGAGAVGYMAAAPADDAQPLAYVAPTLSVGWRYRVSEAATMYADASGARRFGDEFNADLYKTRVGLEFKATSSKRLGMLKQGVFSMQLDSGYRLALRPRRGGVALYLRGEF